MSKRRSFTPEFKTQVVLEMLTGAKTPAQVCREHGLKDSVIHRWRRDFIARAPQVFAGDTLQEEHEAKVAELERMLGRLTIELEIAHLSWRTVPGKKASSYLNSQLSRSGR